MYQNSSFLITLSSASLRLALNAYTRTRKGETFLNPNLSNSPKAPRSLPSTVQHWMRIKLLLDLY